MGEYDYPHLSQYFPIFIPKDWIGRVWILKDKCKAILGVTVYTGTIPVEDHCHEE